MRVVQVAKDGALELNWMWLPTFIGQNHMVCKELAGVWREWYPRGFPVTEEALDEIHDKTIEWFAQRFKIEGLGDYLHAIECIEQE
jgi:hypothetical protein